MRREGGGGREGAGRRGGRGGGGRQEAVEGRHLVSGAGDAEEADRQQP